MAIKPAILGPLAEHVAAGVAGLKALVKHALALPVAVVRVVPGPVTAIAVLALVEHMLGAVIQQRDGRAQIEKGHGRAHDGFGGRGIAATERAGKSIHVVVVEERDDVVLARAIHIEIAHFLPELVGGIAVAEHVLHRLHHRELQGRIEPVAIGAPARQRPVVVGKQLAEHQEVALAPEGGVVADVLRPVAAPVVGHVFDGIHAEAVAVRRVDQVLERLQQDFLHGGMLGIQVIGALELPHDLFRPTVPAVDRAVGVEIAQIVERFGMLVATVPPAKRAVAVGPVALIVVFVAGVDAVFIAEVIGRDVENDVDITAMAVVDQVLKVLERAHRGIALEKVLGVVLMIRRVVGILALVILLHTGNPQRRYTHTCDVVQLLL